MIKNNAVQSIKMPIPGTDKVVDIKLDGKNLIITGGNGCGKTRFLTKLFKNIENIVISDRYSSVEELEREISYLLTKKKSKNNINEIESLKQDIADKENTIIDLSDIQNYVHDFENHIALLRFFEAYRQSHISYEGAVHSVSSMKSDNDNLDLSYDSSHDFERYLVSYYNYGSHMIAREKNPIKGDEIDDWFKKLDEQLQYLFEDETLKLKYNPDEQCFYIHQDGKELYRFNQLSSGYQSILSIYADLLVKVELKEITAEQLSGVVLIDEIDAHLHVSLQRKIFSFFTKAFPNVQFIVTTHSPFVVQSVSDVVIYDLSKNEQLSDLSMYSYDAIVKGLLGVSTMSDVFNKDLDELACLINTKPLDKEKLQILVDKISPYEHELDMRSKAFLLLGKNTLLDAKDEVNG